VFSLDQYPLPFAHDGLEPFMSARTVDFHYGRHMDTYIKNLNALINGTEYENMPLIEIVKRSAIIGADDRKIFEQAAQVFNHDFFFQGLRRNGNTSMPKKIADAFDGANGFAGQFKTAALSVFGSGWVWLVIDNGVITIERTANADTPVAHGRRPLLALDVWEHAYYLDYQNLRGDFVDAFLGQLVNWDWVNGNLSTNSD